jgi:hypothetical protein
MSLLHLSLATLGGAFVAIPIVLHLLMKRQPKPIQFPALRFVRARKESNQRKMRLRQFVLLALRCGIIGCLAFALARPRVPTATAGNWWLLIGLVAGAAIVGMVALFGWKKTSAGGWISSGLGIVSLALLLLSCVVFYRMQKTPTATLLEDAEAPVAAAIVFDVSPRMEYRHQNQSRLEAAKELGEWVLQQFAFDSDVGILDTAMSNASFSVDLATAKKTIAGLVTTANVGDLPQAMEYAVSLLQTSNKPRKEIYVLTDLTARSWETPIDETWIEKVTADPPVMIYFLDVGVERPTNFRITQLDLANAYLAGEQPLEIAYQVSSEGAGGTVSAQVLIEQQSTQLPIMVDGRPELPELTLRGQQQLEVPPGGSVAGRFSLSGIGSGTHHGLLRITGSDGLPIDDTRFFTCEVTRTRDVLIVPGVGAESSLLTDVLGPEGNDRSGQTLFRCAIATPDSLISAELDQYRTVALLDPSPLSVGTWQRLADYVSQGGGLAIFLGRNAIPTDQFNSAAAMELLPGPLSRQWRSGAQDIYLSLGAGDHRIARGLRSRATTVPWNDFPIYRHWGFQNLRDDAVTVLRFGNGQPAMVETVRGKGRVLTMTTPISDALNVANRGPWNLLPTGPNAWPYFVLTFDTFRYLSQSGTTRLNYEIGDAATISHNFRDKVKLFSPRSPWEEVASQQNLVSVPFTNAPGHYRIKGGEANDSRRGCSVNLPDSQTQLTRLTEEELATQLGEATFRMARNREEVDREIGEARMGREFFPWLMLAVALALAMEHLVANRFYAGPGLSTSDSKEAVAA